MHKFVEILSIILFFCALCAFLSLKNPRNLRNPWLVNDLRLFKTLYYCRETVTDVMSAIQIRPFLTNKANFRKSQMNVTAFITRNYEQMDTWSNGKNKPKTNPIQSQYKANTNPIQSQFKAKQTQFPNFPGQRFLIAISGINKYADKNDAKRYEKV
jgi:hypothetical protein